MKLLLALRMGADVGVFGALFLLIGPFHELGPFFALCAGLTILGVYLSGCLKKYHVLRFLPLVLPLTSLLIFSQTVHIVFACLFTAYLLFMAGGGGEMSYWRYKPVYCVTACLAVLAAGLSFVLEAESGWVCALSAVHVLVNGFVLRQLRFGVSDGKGKMLDIVSIVVILATLAAIGIGVYGLLQNDFSFLQTLLFPFAWLLQQLVFLLSNLSKLMKTEHQEEVEIQTRKTEEILARSTMPPEHIEQQSPPPDPFRWEIVIFILGAVLAVYLIWRLLKWMKQSMGEAESGAAALSLETKTLEAEKRRKTKDDDESVKKIRKVYRDYLKFLQARGLFFNRSKTSLDVENAAASSPQPLHADAIRQSYIRVRYGGHQPDGQEVKEARKMLREIKAQKKEQ